MVVEGEAFSLQMVVLQNVLAECCGNSKLVVIFDPNPNPNPTYGIVSAKRD